MDQILATPLCLLALALSLAVPVRSSMGEHPAAWMEGKFGIGFRYPAGSYFEHYYGDNVEYDVEGLVAQLQTGFPSAASSPAWVIVNLSAGAYGDQYGSPHSVLTTLNPGSTPSADRPTADHFLRIATALHNAGIKVIAYMASQGPANLKVHDSDTIELNPIWAAYGDPAAAEARWYGHVQAVYNNTELATLQHAYAEIIVAEYVARFAGIVDGYWFDHCNVKYCDKEAIHTAVKTADPTAVVALNDGPKGAFAVYSPGLEDYTGGHPKTFSQDNEQNRAMVDSVEQSGPYFTQLANGDPVDHPVLGHCFFPTGGTSWNQVGQPVGWDDGSTVRASDWFGRVLGVGGAWTWNLPRNDNHPDDFSVLDETHMDFVRTVVATVIPSAPTEMPTTAKPTTGDREPTVSPTTTTKPTNGDGEPTMLPSTAKPTTGEDEPTVSPTTTKPTTGDGEPTVPPSTAQLSPTTTKPTKGDGGGNGEPTASPSTAKPTTGDDDPTVSPTTTKPTSVAADRTETPTSEPTTKPIDEPTASRTASPTGKDDDGNAARNAGLFGICFSSFNTVRVQGKGPIRMDQLQIGDYVEADNTGAVSRVISFSHLDHDNRAKYLRIHTTASATPLEISHQHMVLLSSGAALPAKDLKVGDVLCTSSSHSRSTEDAVIVTKIDTVQRRGLYAPVTEAGTIVVSGVQASCYVALLDSFPATFQHYAYHVAVGPHRWLCHYNFDYYCATETYTNGISNYIVEIVFWLIKLSNMPTIVQVVAVSAVAGPLLVVIFVLEQLLLFPCVATITALVTYCLWWNEYCQRRRCWTSSLRQTATRELCS